ncbi:DUF1016 N-terminal domain-containing protein [Aquiflexum sp.]|uniref:DUF1016 N-terminal domain-containing protein n=1 Tax=Aquiflexum sp. TaxID=1872584 RepID=UPI003592F604
MNFDLLVNTIQQTHNTLQQGAVKSVNKHLTIRNWLIGFYIVEFEQNGNDRANYGEKLIPELAKSLSIKGLSETSLIINRQFYKVYPQISQTLTDELKHLGFGIDPIPQSLTEELQNIINQLVKIVHSVNAQLKDKQFKN